MARPPFLRRLMKKAHPEGIPWPGSVLYDLLSGTRPFRQHHEVIAHHILGYVEQGRLLDIGTGPGRLLLRLHELAPRLRLFGVDISPAMVARAQKHLAAAGLAGTIAVREGRAAALPFPDAYFDAVVSTFSLHHWKGELPASLNEIHRVLRQGGHALLYDLVSDTPRDVLQKAGRDLGRFKVWLAWLHDFEEPLYPVREMERLPEGSLWGKGRVEFVGISCCLVLKSTE